MSMFQKRHYEAIAKLLGNALGKSDGSEPSEIRELSYRFADRFDADNPNFDRGRFLDAVYKHAGAPT